MKKHIAEDLPARKFPQASLSKGDDRNDKDGQEGDSKSPEKRARQAVYDIKYRARRENIPLRAAYSQYVQNSSMSEQEKALVREKLFGKGGIVKEAYNDEALELASKSVAKALYKVFVEKKADVTDQDKLKNELEEASQGNIGEKKYKVRVSDKNGTSYVRYATREKINSLRANPNIQSVEMTEYGEPYEGEKSKGEQTAAVKSGKDWDGDGKKESKAKEYRGVVHNAIQKRRGGTPDGKDTSNVKEEFLGEVKKNKKDEDKPIDVMKGKNTVKVCDSKDENMNENAYSRFLNIINEKTMTASEISKEKKLKGKYDKSKMKQNMISQYGKEKGENVYFATIRKQAMKEESCDTDKKENDDPRSIPTKVNLVKNKLRSMGLKMDFEPEGELIDERRREEKGTPRSKRNRALEFVRSQNKEGVTTRGGRTVAQHESERGVSEKDRPKKDEETTADRLATKKQKQAASVSARERSERDEERRRKLG